MSTSLPSPEPTHVEFDHVRDVAAARNPLR